jgi:hypothetical protein
MRSRIFWHKWHKKICVPLPLRLEVRIAEKNVLLPQKTLGVLAVQIKAGKC